MMKSIQWIMIHHWFSLTHCRAVMRHRGVASLHWRIHLRRIHHWGMDWRIQLMHHWYMAVDRSVYNSSSSMVDNLTTFSHCSLGWTKLMSHRNMTDSHDRSVQDSSSSMVYHLAWLSQGRFGRRQLVHYWYMRVYWCVYNGTSSVVHNLAALSQCWLRWG